MSEQMVRKTADRVRVRMMVQIAVLGAAATVLMALEFPVPFLAPPFYKLDFSEIPVLVGAFALGPAAGAAIKLLKVLSSYAAAGYSTAGGRGSGKYSDRMLLCDTGGDDLPEQENQAEGSGGAGGREVSAWFSQAV